MPNGTMTGDGSKENPFIVMDGYDFNSLRNITTTSSDYKYIEFGADIDLSMYPVFAPIPTKYVNIDGKGHTITEINIVSGAVDTGLFERLYTNEYVKGLTIEGTLSCTTTSSTACGAFCGRMYLLTDAVVSDVDIYFSVTVSSTSYVKVGGLAGVVEVSGRSNSAIKISAFKGAINVSSTYTTTSTTTFNIIGGIIGQLYSTNPNLADTLLLDRCYAQVKFKINNRMELRMAGIFGDMNHGYNTTTACYQVMVSRCVAQISVQFTHTSDITSKTHRVGGIACVPGYSDKQVTTLDRCVAFIDVLWTHLFPLFDFRMAGLLFAGTSSSQVFTINQGYAVMRMINPDGLPWTGISENLGSVTYLPSTKPTVAVNDAFFDKQVFAESYDGVFTETHGVTTAELKDEAFLTLKGWEFDHGG